jgi:phage protein D
MRWPEVVLPIEQPRVLVSVAGAVLPGVVALELESVGYEAADRFLAVFALGASADSTVAFFAGLAGQSITIAIATAGLGFSTLLVGQVDNVRIDLAANLAELSGRDLTAVLVDAEVSASYVNQTSSQIATAIAEAHGLTPVVTSTSVLVGQYYDRDHARAALGLHARATTAWNLLVALAQIEGFAVDVAGQSLVFGPAGMPAPVAVTVNSFVRVAVDFAATLPGQAILSSWNARSKSVNQAAVGSGTATRLIRPNLSTAEAQRVASAHAAALSGQAMVLAGTMPGDVSLRPGASLQLSGTGSMFDVAYTVLAVRRRVSAAHGFMQAVRACAAAG